MSRIRTNLITNRMANGAPTVSHGLVVAGVTTVTGSINNLNLTGITTISTLDLNGDLDVDGHLNADNVSIAGVVTATSFVGDGSGLTGAGPSLTGSTNNTVVTVTGSNAVQGESNLTFDGTNLKVNSTDAGSYHTIRLNTTTNNAIKDVLHVHSSVDSATAAAGYGVRLNFSGEQSNGNEYTFGGIAGLFNSTGANYGDLAFYTNNNGTNSERLRITSTGNFGINESSPTSQLVVKATTDDNPAIAFYRQSTGGDIAALIWKTASGNQGMINYRGGSGSEGMQFYAGGTASGNLAFRIGTDGKLYKGGTQFYPLVNYTEVTTYSNSSTSSTSYVDLRTIYSSYTPKKAGNRIVIHHQSQMWNGAAANSNSDVYWKIQRQEGGGSWTDTIKNERILGNHDGHSYTGGSGLARHHRTVHLMGSFTCAGTSINLKTQGKSVSGISWDWYHDGNNVLQIWEYDIS